MNIQQKAAVLAQVGTDVANEGLLNDLILKAVRDLTGQVPEGKEVSVAAMILAMAAGRAAALSLHGLSAPDFAQGVEALCQGVNETAHEAHRALIQRGY